MKYLPLEPSASCEQDCTNHAPPSPSRLCVTLLKSRNFTQNMAQDKLGDDIAEEGVLSQAGEKSS